MNGNGPTAREWGELTGDVKHIVDLLAGLDQMVKEDHDTCTTFR